MSIGPLRTDLPTGVVDPERIGMWIGPSRLCCVIFARDRRGLWNALPRGRAAADVHLLKTFGIGLDALQHQVQPPEVLVVQALHAKLASLAVDLEPVWKIILPAISCIDGTADRLGWSNTLRARVRAGANVDVLHVAVVEPNCVGSGLLSEVLHVAMHSAGPKSACAVGGTGDLLATTHRLLLIGPGVPGMHSHLAVEGNLQVTQAQIAAAP
mmetsp:Transcript_7077/g.16784  ORF Transcript_7077/g.16784 Transcript_7077/m.16784 type:complete len:212 (-) Transcript_7077:1023-1658(-)